MAFVPLAHIMAKRARDRKKKEMGGSLVDRSPFLSPPRVGLYGYLDDDEKAPTAASKGEVDEENSMPFSSAAAASATPPPATPNAAAVSSSSSSSIPFKCKSYAVEAKVVHTVAKVRITMHIMTATDDFDFYFPISECGEVSDVHTSIRGVNFAPSIVRRGPATAPPPPQPAKDADEKKDEAAASSSSSSPQKAATSSSASPTVASSLPYDRDTNGLIYPSDEKRFLPEDEDKGTEEKKRMAGAKKGSAAPSSSLSAEERRRQAEKEEPSIYYLHFRKLSAYVRRISAATALKREIDEKLAAAGCGEKDREKFAPPLTESEAFFAGTDRVRRSGPITSRDAIRSASASTPSSKPITPGSIITIVVSYTTRLIEKEPVGSRYHFFFPLTCAPIPPTSISVEFSMKDNIQRIASLNESHVIRPYYSGSKAEVLVTNDPIEEAEGGAGQKAKQKKGDEEKASSPADDVQYDSLGNRVKLQRGQRAAGSGSSTNASAGVVKSAALTRRDCPIMLEDYVFVLAVELGPVIIPQFADPMTLFILATAAILFVFGTLTKDLDDLN